MRTKGRPQSKNIIDKRPPKKIKNNSDKVVVWNNDNSFGGQTEKGMYKIQNFMDIGTTSPFRTKKRKKRKNINAKVKK